jgi:hypothetical protein
VVAVGGVFGVMFPLMHVPIARCYPHLRHPLEWYSARTDSTLYAYPVINPTSSLCLPCDRMGEFLQRDDYRASWICLYWVASLCTALPLAHWASSRHPSARLPQICSRKLFHFLCVLMFAPVIEVDLQMMALSLGVGTCGLLVLEYVR